MLTHYLVALAASASAAIAPIPVSMSASAPAVQASPAPVVPLGTPVRLMVVREINSRTAHAGDRFRLRVDEPVYINGAPAIPVGATAWGEIIIVEGNGAVGKGGKLGAKLLYVDLPSGQVPLRGEANDRGDGNGAGVVLAVVGFGILGLLTGGDSARLKAGDLFTAYVDHPPAARTAESSGPHTPESVSHLKVEVTSPTTASGI
jgi:hypothetical protein